MYTSFSAGKWSFSLGLIPQAIQKIKPSLHSNVMYSDSLSIQFETIERNEKKCCILDDVIFAVF